MELKSDFENKLLKRRELLLNFHGTGISFADARKKISEKFNKDETVIDVYNIIGKFGRRVFEIFADIYDSKEELELIKNMRMNKKKKEESKEQK